MATGEVGILRLTGLVISRSKVPGLTTAPGQHSRTPGAVSDPCQGLCVDRRGGCWDDPETAVSGFIDQEVIPV
jgi:hypothetical protein